MTRPPRARTFARPLALAALAALAASLAPAAHAQDATRIVAATVHPDGATIERELKVPGGTRHIELACLPASVDVSTMQVDGMNDLRLGEIRSEPVLATDAASCRRDPLAAKLRALQDQRGALDARSRSNDLALSYLAHWGQGGGTAPEAGGTAASARAAPAGIALPAPGASSEALRRAALQLMEEQVALKRQLDDVDDASKQLQQTIAASPRRGESWRIVRFDLSTPGPATLHVRYQVRDTRWRPSYRASLDAATSVMRLERQAEIVQGSGEDWSSVVLRLSTGGVRRAPEGTLPTTWSLDLFEPSRQRDMAAKAYAPVMAMSAPMAAPAPESLVNEHRVAEDRDDTPVPTVAVAETAFETEFALSQPVSLPSDGQSHTLTIETRAMDMHLHVRTAPREQAVAWIVADGPRPEGVWPAGTLQLWRDGRRVGATAWQPDATERFSLPFGRDDRVRVEVERPATMTAGSGLFGSRTERRWGNVFTITNQHATPIELEVLDATPVATNEKVKLSGTFDPQPAERRWHQQDGVVAWTTKLAPQQSQKIRETFAVSWPSDAELPSLP
jgi:uncharacterized protein (TIGR02231 family)